ncbi:MAG: DUF3387 domain-containing protein [Tannerella sp.]|nr:DUF3387 domain-containing protein [Tannerella sp.]
MQGFCAVVTSYGAEISDIRGTSVGEGRTEEEFKYETYQKILNGKTPEQYEEWAKSEFINNPASMKLLIVVDKLLTGFDAPPATYLYIDKSMRDHGLFQAICRVNRVNGEEKDFGYIFDYQDLFQSITSSIEDYTSEAFDGYEQEDVNGLLSNRLEEGKKSLEEALQAVVTLCETVYPQTREGFFAWFVYSETTPAELQTQEMETNAEKREKLYRFVNQFVRRYLDVANEMQKIGYSADESRKIKEQVDFYNDLKDEIKLKSGDALDTKMYDPAMRQLIDAYVRAEDSETLFNFDDVSFLDLVAMEGKNAIGKLPKNIRDNFQSVAEALQANMRKVFIYERPNNPAYYDKLSDILQKLIDEVRQGRITYREHIGKLIELIQQHKNRTQFSYPASITSDAMRVLYDNLNNDEELTLKVHNAIITNAMDGWKDGTPPQKTKKVRLAIAQAMKLDASDEKVINLLTIAKNQPEY